MVSFQGTFPCFSLLQLPQLTPSLTRGSVCTHLESSNTSGQEVNIYYQYIYTYVWGGGSHSVLSESLWTAAQQAPLYMESSRQEYWSGLPFPSPWNLPDPGIEPWSPTLKADSLLSESPGKIHVRVCVCVCVYTGFIWASLVVQQ